MTSSGTRDRIASEEFFDAVEGDGVEPGGKMPQEAFANEVLILRAGVRA